MQENSFVRVEFGYERMSFDMVGEALLGLMIGASSG